MLHRAEVDFAAADEGTALSITMASCSWYGWISRQGWILSANLSDPKQAA